ncbi:MAG: hypothetical protein V3T00_02120, partial [bacterium]
MNAKELFQALEFSHYAERFRDNVFVVALPLDVPFQDLLLDIKVLLGYHIRVVLVVPDPDFAIEEVIRVSNKRGTRFQLAMMTGALYDPAKGALGLDLERMRGALAAGKSPVIAYHAEFGGDHEIEPTYALAATVAERLGANKLFLVGRSAGAIEAALPRTHVTADELEALLGRPEGAGLEGAGLDGHGPLLDFIRGGLAREIPDIVLLEGKSSQLFREVFTHDGAGILFNTARRALVRQARVRDTTDIALLLRPE